MKTFFLIAEENSQYGEGVGDQYIRRLQSVKRLGYYSRECPQCGSVITGIEPNDQLVHCDGCDQTVEIEPLSSKF
jgi:ribosomal protein L37AE/L43A